MSNNDFKCSMQYGFSLIEIMIVIAIIGIIASFAVPSYRNSIMKSHRFLAKSALLDLAARQEKYYMSNHKYAALLTDLGYTNADVKDGSSSEVYYKLAMKVTAAKTTTPAVFSAQAIPSGSQAGDQCATFTFDSSGNHGNIGAKASGCW